MRLIHRLTALPAAAPPSQLTALGGVQKSGTAAPFGFVPNKGLSAHLRNKSSFTAIYVQ